ncbi:nucleotidyltransferase family protein [Microbacterium sediminicola]|uniref:nucleotidyltransferase family protein n=1 Tax=Microbacterium sediminicola TaxID=415210 RepID=UPI0031CE9613
MTTLAAPSVGIVLAAGAGTRYGMPKALARMPDGTPWLELVCVALWEGGCDEVIVVLGARAEEAARVVPDGARSVVATAWQSGLSASTRAGLDAAGDADAQAAIVVPVDVPGMPSAVVTRVRASIGGADALARAVYDGSPGHPVLLGRHHWRPLGRRLAGDSGARRYLEAEGAQLIECGDLWDGHDVDTR